MTSLDDLLPATEPHATFHDAALVALQVDYAAGTLTAEFRLFVGATRAASVEEREAHRTGFLELTGLLFWTQEPPSDFPVREDPLPWLTADGPLHEAPTAEGKRLAERLPADAWSCYMYFSDLNSFAYLAARRAFFRWSPVSGAPEPITAADDKLT